MEKNNSWAFLDLKGIEKLKGLAEALAKSYNVSLDTAIDAITEVVVNADEEIETFFEDNDIEYE